MMKLSQKLRIIPKAKNIIKGGKLMSLSDNLSTVKQNIQNALNKRGETDCNKVTIVAVTKKRSVEEIDEMVSLGVTELGENRVQELLEKYDKVKGNVNWHLIGTLQKNKVKYIADKVVMIHSVESESLAGEIDKQCKKIGKVMDVLVQVNVSGEESKSGIRPEDAFDFIKKIKDYSSIRVRGLMTMAPLNEEKGKISKIFEQLYQLSVDISEKKYDNISMEYLSMGMSNDYDLAVEQGANIVRVGSALFK